jgi:hypothetical protein
MADHVLSSAELAYEYAPERWGALMPDINNLPYEEWPAIFKSWLDEVKAGRQRGRPRGGEQGLRSGGVVQEFEFGDAFFKDGACSWRG